MFYLVPPDCRYSILSSLIVGVLFSPDMFKDMVLLCLIIRIYHECEGKIEKAVQRVAVWHYETCQVMTNGGPEGRIFRSLPHTNNGFFFLLTTVSYAPAIYNGGGGHIASPLSVRPVRPVPYVRKMVSKRYHLKTLVYWIHISIIKYRSSSIMDKIQQLLSELWPLISE